jgi:hypothetical protein
MQLNNTKNHIDNKIEINYSDYIEIKNQLNYTKEQLNYTKEQLEYTQKDLELIKNNINNNGNLLQHQILTKLTNNEHLMQQLLKSYYDKETEQIKVYDNLPYIIIKNVHNIIEERILHEKSQLIWLKPNCNKILNYLVSNENIKNKHIKNYIGFFNGNPHYDIQIIIPAKKMLKIWKYKVINISTNPQKPILEKTFFPVDIYTTGIYFINQVNAFAIWYGDIDCKNDVPDDFDFKYIYDNIDGWY